MNTSSRLSDFRGHPVVVAFSAGAWDPTRAECIESYNRLIAQLPSPAGTQLLGIVGEGPWRELAFADQAFSIPVLTDESGAIARELGVSEEHGVAVLDESGAVRWRHVGGVGQPARIEDLASALASLNPNRVTRRDFIATALAASIVLALTPVATHAEAIAGTAPTTPNANGGGGGRAPGDPVPVTLRVNGRDISLTLEPRVTLLDALREYAGLTGSKKGCDHGQCGACTVHIDGKRYLSCLTLAVMQQGKDITTIEGLAARGGGASDTLHPMQAAFLEHDGFQCGYCTPGQIMSAVAFVNEPYGPSDDDVREGMSGNLCRCGAYPNIVAAVQSVRKPSAANTDGAAPRR